LNGEQRGAGPTGASGYTTWTASGHRQRAEELAGGHEAFVEGAQRLLAASRARRLVASVGPAVRRVFPRGGGRD
jgi:hypothetical protein